MRGTQERHREHPSQAAERGSRVSKAAFQRGLLVETSGPKDEVVKLLPALTTTDEQLDIGIATLREAIAESA